MSPDFRDNLSTNFSLFSPAKDAENTTAEITHVDESKASPYFIDESLRRADMTSSSRELPTLLKFSCIIVIKN